LLVICRELASLATSRCSICAPSSITRVTAGSDITTNSSSTSCSCSDRALAKLLSVKMMAAADRQARLKLQLTAEASAGAVAAAAAAAKAARWASGIADVLALSKVRLGG
jgi:hypothetical protein